MVSSIVSEIIINAFKSNNIDVYHDFPDCVTCILNRCDSCDKVEDSLSVLNDIAEDFPALQDVVYYVNKSIRNTIMIYWSNHK